MFKAFILMLACTHGVQVPITHQNNSMLHRSEPQDPVSYIKFQIWKNSKNYINMVNIFQLPNMRLRPLNLLMGSVNESELLKVGWSKKDCREWDKLVDSLIPDIPPEL